MSTFVAYRAGAFRGTGKTIEGAGDTIYKRDTVMLAEYIVISDSGWYEPVYIYSSKAMRMDDSPRLFMASNDTVMYGTPRADSIVNAKTAKIILDPIYMGGSKSGEIFSPEQIEPILTEPENSGKKNKKARKKK